MISLLFHPSPPYPHSRYPLILDIHIHFFQCPCFGILPKSGELNVLEVYTACIKNCSPSPVFFCHVAFPTPSSHSLYLQWCSYHFYARSSFLLLSLHSLPTCLQHQCCHKLHMISILLCAISSQTPASDVCKLWCTHLKVILRHIIQQFPHQPSEC